jgi:hypothetical protein
MEDYAVFEEGMLERIGVTCARCGTTVTYDLSEELAVKKLTCSYCQRVLLDVVDACIDTDRELPQQYSWLTLYKWLRGQAKENTICFYFPRGRRRPCEVPDRIFEEVYSPAGAQPQR